MKMPKTYLVCYCLGFILLILVVSAYYSLCYLLRRRSPEQRIHQSDIMRFSNATWARRRIPRLIHQTWRTNDIPLRWNVSYHSVIEQNGDEFKHHLWTDIEMRAFVQKHEPEFYQNTYSSYAYEIQRADSFRYVVLYHLGGIYIDMDNACNRPLKDLVNTLEALDPDAHHLAAFPLDLSYGIDIDFLISTPGHPLYKQLISRLPLFNHYYLLHFYTIVLSTGPLYATIQVRLFNASSQHSAVRVIDDVVVHPIFTSNVGGKSWLARDAPIQFFIDSHIDLFIRYSKILLIFFIIVVSFLCRRPIRCCLQTAFTSARKI